MGAWCVGVHCHRLPQSGSNICTKYIPGREELASLQEEADDPNGAAPPATHSVLPYRSQHSVCACR